MGDDSTTTFAEGVTLPTRGENAILHLLAVFHPLNFPFDLHQARSLSAVSCLQFPPSPHHPVSSKIEL